MKATNFLLDDDRGFIASCVTLIHAALDPLAPVHRTEAKKPGWFDRLEDWLARGRQRELERYLASSADIFELEARMRDLERRPYY